MPKLSPTSKKPVKKAQKGLKSALQDSSKYSKDLELQITLTSRILAVVDKLSAEVLAPDHLHVISSTNRDGRTIYEVNPVDRLFIRYVSLAQSGLKSLGLNRDSKAVPLPPEEDEFSKLMKSFQDDDDDEED